MHIVMLGLRLSSGMVSPVAIGISGLSEPMELKNISRRRKMISSKTLKTLDRKELLTVLTLVVLEAGSRKWDDGERMEIVEAARDLLNVVVGKSDLLFQLSI